LINNKLAMVLSNPIRFIRPGRGGKLALAYEATVLVDLCEVILKARDDNLLNEKQLVIAKQCEILMRGFGRVGIIALIDEVTGYQYDRSRTALEKILEAFVSKELAKWVKTFPDEFYEQMFRLRKWNYDPSSVDRPPIIGKYTNDLVYARLAPGVLDELKRITPKDPKGRRKHRYFQRLTEDVGNPRLREHLAAVIAFMRASTSWNGFYKLIQRAFPKVGDQPSIFDEEDLDT
jgi:hypothetical protein